MAEKLDEQAAPELGAGDDDEKSTKTVTLISSDNERFDVPEEAARLSQTVRNMIEDACTDGGIRLPNVAANVLAKVLEYCNKHAAAEAASAAATAAEAAGGSNAATSEAGSSSGAPTATATSESSSEDELKSFDKAFIDVDQAMLYDLLLASNYLEVKGLLDLCCQKVADMIKGKSPEEIRQTFGIKNDFTPEEYEEIRKENSWAFEQP
ncbi:hypothetical protein ACP70R_043478 [Stipagrostis hirtigluma subsp. patula]